MLPLQATLNSRVPSLRSLKNFDIPKPVVITLIALKGIGLMTVGLLDRCGVIKGLNSTSQRTLIGLGVLIEGSLAVNLIAQAVNSYQDRNPFPNGALANIDDENHLTKIKHFGWVNLNKAQKAIAKGKAAEMLFQFLANPKEDLMLVIGSNRDSLKTYFFPYLSECACIMSQNFNRFKNSRRSDLENQMLEDTTFLFPPLENRILRYLSLGGGGLLQDFINIGLLIQAGYKEIDAVFADPKFHNNYDTDYYRSHPEKVKVNKMHKQGLQERFEFLFAAAEELGITLNIIYLPFIEEAVGSFHIIQAIDFDVFEEAFKDVMKAHDLLEENGRFYQLRRKTRSFRAEM